MRRKFSELTIVIRRTAVESPDDPDSPLLEVEFPVFGAMHRERCAILSGMSVSSLILNAAMLRNIPAILRTKHLVKYEGP
jgi:hypothetical protein